MCALVNPHRPGNLFPTPPIYTPEAYSVAMDRFRPESFLPLTPVAFEILLALADGEQHGYSIMREVERRSAGSIVLHPGTLYRALARLLETGLIQELDERPAERDDERRRYYELTARGIAVARAEAGRLASQVDAARARRLLENVRA
jgi:DNA-binding PadR family transcriptional regulator